MRLLLALLAALPAAAVQTGPRIRKVGRLNPALAAAGTTRLAPPLSARALKDKRVPAQFVRFEVHDMGAPITALSLGLTVARRGMEDKPKALAQLEEAAAATKSIEQAILAVNRRVPGAVAAEGDASIEEIDRLHGDVSANLEVIARSLGRLQRRSAAIPDAQLRFIDSLAAQAERLRRRADHLREGALQGEGLEPALQPVAARELLSGAADMLRGMIEAKRLSVSVEAPEELPAPVTDRLAAQRIVENFLSNAIKYSPEGGAVRLTAQRGSGDKRGMLLLSVTDEGPGLTPEQLAQVWEPGVQVGPAEINAQGSGLGLAGVRRNARLLRGETDATSRPGGGSTFSLALPVGPQTMPTVTLGQAAHDLRNLLNTPYGGISMVERDPTASGLVKFRASLLRERLKLLIERLSEALERTRAEGKDARSALEDVEKFAASLREDFGFIEAVLPEIDHPSVSDMGRKGLEIVRRNLPAARAQLARLAEVARTGVESLNVERAAAEPLLREAVEVMGEPRDGIRVEFAPMEGLSDVLVDRALVSRALQNFLSNALKFSPPGGVITVGAAEVSRAGKAGMLFTVSDQGQGIPAADRERIFGAFEQAGDDASKAKGLGLGLSMVRKVALLHGGDARAVDGPGGRGATLELFLPLR